MKQNKIWANQNQVFKKNNASWLYRVYFMKASSLNINVIDFINA